LVAWTTPARAALIVVLGLGVALGVLTYGLEARSVLPAAVLGAGWVAAAVNAWRGGRAALFVLVLPVFWMPAGFVGAEFSTHPCALRAPDPSVEARDETFRPLPPHYVCELAMSDGRKEYDGGPPGAFFIAFGWAALATALALARRPRPIVRGALIAGAWLLATYALFL
jgi:hypothetical protein